MGRQNHRDMVERLKDQNEAPDNRGFLHIYLNFISDPVFCGLALEAEMSPGRVNLIRAFDGPQERSRDSAEETALHLWDGGADPLGARTKGHAMAGIRWVR